MFASRNRHPRHDKIAEALMEASHLLSDKDAQRIPNVFTTSKKNNSCPWRGSLGSARSLGHAMLEWSRLRKGPTGRAAWRKLENKGAWAPRNE